ncbi:MAG: 6-bladed beta-propeller, partial [Tannerellaceae bacterium]|nr:6-bladed beta-propeller [Tannerellaceae bacterium]
MKKLLMITATILFASGLGGCKQAVVQGDGLLTVDVTASYPKKELILQDFMDVEYIALETNDEFVTQGFVRDITRNMIIARNHPQDGNIFLFDRSGKAIKRINRHGQGGEEYNIYMQIVLDEEKGEIYISDRPSHRILVYDLDGNYKRTIKHGDDINFDHMYNFDRDNIICNNSWEKINRKPFAIISKQDGSVTGEIRIQANDDIHMRAEFENELYGSYNYAPDSYKGLIPYLDSWILVEQSSDTVYRYLPDHTLTPFIVRTPPVSMDTKMFLLPSMFTERYYFMDAVKVLSDESKDLFPATHLMFDKEEGAI